MGKKQEFDINKCWNCLYEWQKVGLCSGERHKLCKKCRDNNYNHYSYNDKMPLYHFELAKQLIFDCVMELEYGTEGMNNKEIAEKLHCILEEIDKMKLKETESN